MDAQRGVLYYSYGPDFVWDKEVHEFRANVALGNFADRCDFLTMRELTMWTRVEPTLRHILLATCGMPMDEFNAFIGLRSDQ